MGVELQIHAQDAQVRRVRLESAAYTIGRAHNNDLCYPEDASLSRRHLKIEREGTLWKVEDLGSKNGTLLNGARLTGQHKLRLGDQIIAGQLHITYLDPEQQETPKVVFVPEAPSGALPRAETLVTSLEGLLSGEPTTESEVPGRAALDARQAFDSPIVKALIRAGRELAGDRPLDDLFPLILKLSIDAVGAERGLLMTLDGGALITRAVHGEGFRISTTVRDRVLNNKNSVLVRDVAQEEALLNQLSISEQQIHSLMAVPLQTANDVIGLIYVDSRMFVREFTPDDLNLLTVLANVAAIRIDHERHKQLKEKEDERTRDLRQAAEIQRTILPEHAPEVDGLDLAGYNSPCRMVGGDYYDFIRYPDGRVAVILGDVAGKGMAAALLVSSLQARVQLLAVDCENVASFMGRLDRAVSTNCPSNRFITMFICVIDPETGIASYCNAGHNPGFLVRHDGEVERLVSVGTVLGIMPDLGYAQQDLLLQPGDMLAIYSDGITEALADDGGEFGEARLADLLADLRTRPVDEIVESVTAALDDWTGSAPPADDVTLVVARRTPAG